MQLVFDSFSHMESNHLLFLKIQKENIGQNTLHLISSAKLYNHFIFYS